MRTRMAPRIVYLPKIVEIGYSRVQPTLSEYRGQLGMISDLYQVEYDVL